MNEEDICIRMYVNSTYEHICVYTVECISDEYRGLWNNLY